MKLIGKKYETDMKLEISYKNLTNSRNFFHVKKKLNT